MITKLHALLFYLTLNLSTVLADDVAIHHAPIGVMGDHLHNKDEWMISMRITQMTMQGNILNGKNLSDSEILEQPNPFLSIPNMPTKLSVIPQNMSMRMFMLGVMYAPTNSLTLMGMSMFEDKGMKLNTHQGMMTRQYLGSFKTSTLGLSNVSITGLYKLHKNSNTRSHLHLGFQKGVGKNAVTASVLTPMNSQSTVTLPYGMQTSDRSARIIYGITNVSTFKNFVLGNQLIFNTPVSTDPWHFGDSRNINSWIQKAVNNQLSLSCRLNYRIEDSITGEDPTIMAAVQTANARNYGGKILSLGLGANTVFNLFGGKHGDRLAVEWILPISQHKNGLQMKDSFVMTIGYQKSF